MYMYACANHLYGEDVAPVARVVVLVALLAGEATIHGLVHLLVAAYTDR